MKDFEEMDCPVCGKMHFSVPLQDFYEDELKAYNEGKIRCRHCGWIYDFNQVQNPDSSQGYNKISLKKYKTEYNDKLQKNKEYDYFFSNKLEAKKHKCPVCNEYEFSDSVSFEICPVCGWQDDGFEKGDGINFKSAIDTKKDFEATRDRDKDYKWVDMENGK